MIVRDLQQLVGTERDVTWGNGSNPNEYDDRKIRWSGGNTARLVPKTF